jgi:hypothetical protein
MADGSKDLAMVFTSPIYPPDRRVIDRTTTKAYLVGGGIA